MQVTREVWRQRQLLLIFVSSGNEVNVPPCVYSTIARTAAFA
jgi:hypothetical protein